MDRGLSRENFKNLIWFFWEKSCALSNQNMQTLNGTGGILNEWALFQLDFVWITRDQKSLQWFLELLKKMEEVMDRFSSYNPHHGDEVTHRGHHRRFKKIMSGGHHADKSEWGKLKKELVGHVIVSSRGRMWTVMGTCMKTCEGRIIWYIHIIFLTLTHYLFVKFTATVTKKVRCLTFSQQFKKESICALTNLCWPYFSLRGRYRNEGSGRGNQQTWAH